MCVLTVDRLMWRPLQISALDSPRATAASTSCSRSVKAGSAARARVEPAGREAKSSISRRVTLGARSPSPAAITRIAARSSSGMAALSRNPLAPTRSAS